MREHPAVARRLVQRAKALEMKIFSPLYLVLLTCPAWLTGEVVSEGSSLPAAYARGIRKCCPDHLYLNDWYECVEVATNVSKEFRTELLYVGLSDYRVVRQSDGWKKCSVRDRREYEVINIPEDDDGNIYVLSDTVLSYDVSDEEEVNFDGVLETKYDCIEVTADPQTLVAVVCEEDEKEEEKHFVQKCCPHGKVLGEDFSSCVDSELEWISPRKILHSKTERMTGSFDLKFGHMCGKDETVVTVNLHSVLTDGTFFALAESQDGQTLAKKVPYQCVDTVDQNTESGNVSNVSKTDLVAIVCIKDACTTEFCVSKCCPENELFKQIDNQCATMNKDGYLWTYDGKFHDQNLNLIPEESMKHVKVEYDHSFMKNQKNNKNRIPSCEKVIILDKSNNDSFHLLQNGSLHHQDYGVTKNYCVDNSLDLTGNVVEIALKCVLSKRGTDSTNEEIINNLPHSCVEEYTRMWLLFNTLSGLISCVFLIVTFLVYIIVPELNNLHGKIVISNVFAIFMSTVYILCVYNFSDYFHGFVCKIIGYGGYFFTISMFSWMTIMSFDLCWTFIRAKIPRRGLALLKFVIYSSLAWGLSIALTITIIIADQILEEQGDNKTMFFSKPNVGLTKCFLEDESQGLYLHLPIFILMMINSFFFIITISTLYRSSLTTHQARYARQKNHLKQFVPTRINQETKEQLLLYSKLFTVMGILWIFECIHYLLHRIWDMDCVSSTEFVLRIIGCINLLRGCLIFFIFVCKDSTRKKIGKLSVWGLKLSFIKHTRQQNIDSSTSKATLVTTDSGYCRQESDVSIPLIHLQDSYGQSSTA